MSSKIFECNGVTIGAYAGPARSDDGPRMRLQIGTSDTTPFPANTISFEEARRLHRMLGRFIGDGLYPNTGLNLDDDGPAHIDLGHQLVMTAGVHESDGFVATIARMPDDTRTPDVMILRSVETTVGECRRELAKELRAIAMRLDGLPTVTSIEVRNDPVSWEPGQGEVRVSDNLERLKVMVELEHEPHPYSHIVFEQVVEPMNQTISYAANAYHFAGRRIDPVSERWRRERKGAPATSDIAGGDS